MNTVDDFATILRLAFPGVRVRVDPHADTDDPDIEGFITLLGVPAEQIIAATNRAWELAEEQFGDRPIPVHIVAVTPEHAARHYPERESVSQLWAPMTNWVVIDDAQFVVMSSFALGSTLPAGIQMSVISVVGSSTSAHPKPKWGTWHRRTAGVESAATIPGPLETSSPWPGLDLIYGSASSATISSTTTARAA